MLDYKTVIDADLAPLSEAVAKWAKLPVLDEDRRPYAVRG